MVSRSKNGVENRQTDGPSRFRFLPSVLTQSVITSILVTVNCVLSLKSVYISPNSVRSNLLKTCSKPSFREVRRLFQVRDQVANFFGQVNSMQVLNKIEAMTFGNNKRTFVFEQLTNRNAGKCDV